MTCKSLIINDLRRRGGGVRKSLRCNDLRRLLFSLDKKMVGAVGFEPTTNGLKGRCSTVELHARKGPSRGELLSQPGHEAPCPPAQPKAYASPIDTIRSKRNERNSFSRSRTLPTIPDFLPLVCKVSVTSTV